MSLLLDVEGLSSVSNDPSSVSVQGGGPPNSAFHRFTALPQVSSIVSGPIPNSISNHMNSTGQNNVMSQADNRVISPGRNYLEVAGVEPGSPTSSTASDSHSPPTVRKRSKGRQGDDDDDEDEDDRETSQTDGDNTFAWPTHSTYDEQRQLLGTEEDSSDHLSSDDDELLAGERQDRSEHRKNVWNITKEQLNYYTTQFFSMQANPDGVIPGNQAKEFFEKSSLPIAELRKIWQLSDVTMDGCLSLEEFLTAMHLVVLRRNNITLPDSLPTCLRPTFLKAKLDHSHKKQVQRDQLKETTQTEMGRRRHNKDLYETSEETANERLIDDSEGGETSKEDAADGLGSLPPSAPIASESEGGSVISSPGGRPTPVNFDFARPDAKRDPHIVQPVAVRLSPESPVVQSSDVDDDELEHRQKLNRRLHGVGNRDVGYEQLWNAAKDDQEDEESDDSDASDVDSRRYGPVSLPSHQHQQPPPQHPMGLSKKEGTPPPPPPRTSRSHARSSSLDLNRYPVIRQQQQPPPAVPPRYPPGIADPSGTPTKAIPALTAVARQPMPAPSVPSMVSLNRDARSLQISIHEYRERNSCVARTINELHQEVSDALEERIALEYQLEQLKSFGD